MNDTPSVTWSVTGLVVVQDRSNEGGRDDDSRIRYSVEESRPDEVDEKLVRRS